MKLALIFDRHRADTTGGYLERASRSLGIETDHWWLRDAARIPEGYDCYVRVDHGDDYLVRLPARLRPAAFYAIDTHLPHSWRKIQQAAEWYDALFCCHLAGARGLRGAEWLPVACDPQLHGGPREADRPETCDVAFVGTDGAMPRKFLLQALRERYPNSRIGSAPHTELAAIYGRAKIVFNYSIADDVNMRMFEAMAAGSLLVTNAIRGEELDRLGFEDARHLILYHTLEELFDLIDGYLRVGHHRRAIAQCGQALVLSEHTYAHRLRQMLAALSRTVGLRLPPRLAAPPSGRSSGGAFTITRDWSTAA